MTKNELTVPVSTALERATRDRAKKLGIDRMDPRYAVLLAEMAIQRGDIHVAMMIAVQKAREISRLADACAVSKEARGDAIKAGGSDEEIKKRYVYTLTRK